MGKLLRHHMKIQASTIAMLLLAGGCFAGSTDCRIYVNSIGMTFVRLPAGRFKMGSPVGEPGRHNTEILHTVAVTRPFYMQETEVSQQQWGMVMTYNPSDFKGQNLPVESVSWDEVHEFIIKLNMLPENKAGLQYRLPTEAEWEYAARAGAGSAYYFGENSRDLGKYAWYRGNSGGRTHDVAQKLPNARGLYDMHGNVWEWVEDFYGDYGPVAAVDPKGPGIGTIRVRRGGGWMSTVYSCRSASRSGNEPDYKVFSVGFRLAAELPVE